MIELPFGLRARRDYIVFRFRAYWPFYLSLAGLSLTVLSLVASLAGGKELGWIVAFVGVMALTRRFEVVKRTMFPDAEFEDNGPTVRLLSDLTPGAIASGSEIRFQPAGYFDDECSNKLVGTHAVAQGGSSSLSSFDRRYVLDREGRLRDLSTSQLANAVGASTGSLEPSNYAQSLGEFLTRGMEREFREERNLDSKIELQTQLTGWGRWMARGGKPEFFGVTRVMALDSKQVNALPVKRSERVFTTKFQCEPIDLAALATLNPSVSLETLPGVPATLHEHASMPLLLALGALGVSLKVGHPSIAGLLR